MRHDAEKPDGEIVIVNTCGFIGDAKERKYPIQFCNLNAKKRKNGQTLCYGMFVRKRYLKDLEAEIPWGWISFTESSITPTYLPIWVRIQS